MTRKDVSHGRCCKEEAWLDEHKACGFVAPAYLDKSSCALIKIIRKNLANIDATWAVVRIHANFSEDEDPRTARMALPTSLRLSKPLTMNRTTDAH